MAQKYSLLQVSHLHKHLMSRVQMETGEMGNIDGFLILKKQKYLMAIPFDSF